MLEKMTLSKKITSGFFAILALMLIVGLIGFVAINKAGSGFSQYRGWARDANLVGRVQANILMARMNVKDYLQTKSQKDIDEFNEYVESTNVFLEQAVKEIKNPERAKLIQDVVENLDQYEIAFPKVIKLMEKRDEITNGVLRTDGPLAERTLNEIMVSTQNSGHSDLTYAASQAMRHLLLARIYGTQFLDNNSEKASDRVLQELGLTQEQLDILDNNLKSSAMRNKYDIVQKSVNNYRDSFENLVSVINERNEIITGTLDRLGPIFAKDIEDVKLSVKTDQDRLGPIVQRSNLISMIIIVVVAIIALLFGFYAAKIITKAITTPIINLVEISKNIANVDMTSLSGILANFADGDLSQNFNITSNKVDVIVDDEIGALSNAFNLMLDNFNNVSQSMGILKSNITDLIDETKVLSGAAVEGKLDVRGDISKFQGDYKNIVQGVNETLDAVIGPLNVSAEYIDRISKGDIPERITDTYNGDFNEIKNNLNMCIDAVNGLVDEAKMLTKAAVEGKLDVRGDANKFNGDYKGIVQGVNETLDAVIGPLNVTAEYVDRISKGDIPERITDTYNGDFNEIKNNLNSAIDVMNGLLKETDKLILATKNGQLDTRGEASRFKGGWGDLISGVNDLINAFVGPINVTAEYVDRISKGDIPEKITDEYKGDFNEIKNNLNSAIDVMNGLLEETDKLIVATKNGQLDTRGDASRFSGGWGDLISGVNDLINAFVRPINVTADYVDRISNGDIPEKITDEYKGDFNKIKNNLNMCIDAVNGLVAEAAMLTKAAVNGQLNVRGEAGKFQGDYKDIVQGVNDTLDAIVLPMQEAASVMSKIADKDITARVTGNYKGQLDEFKNDINIAASNLDDALQNIANSVEQVSSASEQVAKGSQQLAEGSNEQASSIEEVSASLEQMSSMTQQNSDNSNQAKALADTAHKEAVSGKSNMDRMSDAIMKIKESSDETSKIVKTIDEIAFQTNLLALNAAVEAARAGEAGKGFAVVAEEVRNLAQRSAEAAKNTSQLIEESVENADNGVKITTEAAKGLEAIVDSVKKTNDLINEIAAASKEQATGIDQVSTAVQEMNKVTQENASNSEESASAAEEMSSQAVSMTAMIAEFSLSNKNKTMSLGKVALAPKREVIKQKPQKKSQVVKPDEVIPLDDDDFDDF